jgi:hypothetical protein
MLAQIIILYLLIKLFYGTDRIDNFFINSGKFLFNKTYPVFKTDDYFNTPTLRIKWWNNLDQEWRTVFRFQVYPELDYHGIDIANYMFTVEKLNLNLNGIKTLNGLKHLTQLRELCITNYGSTDLSDLKNLHKLQKLKFINCDFSSIVPITPIKQVTDLNFENCQVFTMDSFQYLKNLKRLQLQFNCIIDISPIRKASQLEFLSLQNNPITNFDALAHLPDTKIELSFNQQYDLKKMHDKNIKVDIAFTNTYYNYDEPFFQNN